MARAFDPRTPEPREKDFSMRIRMSGTQLQLNLSIPLGVGGSILVSLLFEWLIR